MTVASVETKNKQRPIIELPVAVERFHPMAGGCAWSRRLGARQRSLRALVRDTQRALHDVVDVLAPDPELPELVASVGARAAFPTALVVLGASRAARARLLHALLGRRLLPEPLPRGCRWIRIQFGATTQVHLSVGDSEFELVEELHCNKTPWDVLPVQDILRKDPADLTTILEVEINNPFLKDGLRIVLPPDIACEPSASNYHQLKSIHTELYRKRSSILKSFHPVYLYAIDRIGKNIFCDNICDKMAVSRSEEDFWSTFNLYETKWGGCEGSETGGGEREVPWPGRGEPAVFNAENCLDLHQVRDVDPHGQLLFLLLADAEELEDSARRDLPGAGQGLLGVCRNMLSASLPSKQSCAERMSDEHSAFMSELIDQWELMCSPPLKHHVRSQWAVLDDTFPAGKHDARRPDKLLRSRTALLSTTLKFATDCLQTTLLQLSTKLSEVHVKLLQQFILASFDMARELQIVPKKIQYVAMQEQHLYDTINEKFAEGDKKQELVQVMQEVLQEIREDVDHMDWSVDDLPWHQDERFISNSTFYSSTRDSVSLSPSHRLSPSIVLSSSLASDASDGEEASDSCWLEDYDIIPSSEESCSDYYTAKPEQAVSPPSTIRVENEDLSSLSHTRSLLWSGSDVTSCTNSTSVSVKHATLDVQRTVLSRLSRKISLKLVKFVDCLKETYFGTLQRCVESLEAACRRSLGGRPASEAVRRLLAAVCRVELQPGVGAAASLARALLDSLARLLHRLRLSGGGGARAPCCVLSAAWRRRVALHAVHSLSAPRLARLVSHQIVERLRAAHESFQAALGALSGALAGRLHHTEDVKLAVRKKYAPMFARLCLESTSMCDLLMYGIPDLGREIGRGQYGVVYAGRGAWGGRAPVAVKSVLPADERHYHELAMEFFYTRSIPAHPRIVRLFGSIVQKGVGGAGGGGRSVLLVSERASRDLHAAVRGGLAPSARMRVACDIVQGIRYLHSLGLVHRDIKLKNVLLDSSDRAALSDLGFCSYGALMSGSVVGTPVHMAPELFNGEYSASVDVYAFGILFWYLCAGDVKLPAAFEAFHNKEQLWSKVKKGLRPERLPQFTDECWQLMEECWRQEPARRPLPGDLLPRLRRLLHTHPYSGDGSDTTETYD